MNKKKAKAMTCAVAAALAFLPFLGGCAVDNAVQVEEADVEDAEESAREQAGTGKIDDAHAIRYGQVDIVDGGEVVVTLGELAPAPDGAGGESVFLPGYTDITFRMDEVMFVDDAGDELTDVTLPAQSIVLMTGTGVAESFRPEKVQIVDISLDEESAAAADEKDAAADDAAARKGEQGKQGQQEK